MEVWKLGIISPGMEWEPDHPKHHHSHDSLALKGSGTRYPCARTPFGLSSSPVVKYAQKAVTWMQTKGVLLACTLLDWGCDKLPSSHHHRVPTSALDVPRGDESIVLALRYPQWCFSPKSTTLILGTAWQGIKYWGYQPTSSPEKTLLKFPSWFLDATEGRSLQWSFLLWEQLWLTGMRPQHPVCVTWPCLLHNWQI